MHTAVPNPVCDRKLSNIKEPNKSGILQFLDIVNMRTLSNLQVTWVPAFRFFSDFYQMVGLGFGLASCITHTQRMR